jgi:hypothetical protein
MRNFNPKDIVTPKDVWLNPNDFTNKYGYFANDLYELDNLLDEETKILYVDKIDDELSNYPFIVSNGTRCMYFLPKEKVKSRVLPLDDIYDFIKFFEIGTELTDIEAFHILCGKKITIKKGSSICTTMISAISANAVVLGNKTYRFNELKDFSILIDGEWFKLVKHV